MALRWPSWYCNNAKWIPIQVGVCCLYTFMFASKDASHFLVLYICKVLIMKKIHFCTQRVKTPNLRNEWGHIGICNGVNMANFALVMWNVGKKHVRNCGMLTCGLHLGTYTSTNCKISLHLDRVGYRVRLHEPTYSCVQLQFFYHMGNQPHMQSHVATNSMELPLHLLPVCIQSLVMYNTNEQLPRESTPLLSPI